MKDLGSATTDPAHRRFVSYIDKSREFYQAHGYGKPYRWATNAAAPFASPTKPLSECTVGVVTTTFPYAEADKEHRPAKEVYAQATSPHPDRMFTEDLSWDKEATHTNDVETFLPLARLEEFVASGRIGGLAKRFYGVPTEYSQRRTGLDAENIGQWCREDDVDVVLLIPL